MLYTRNALEMGDLLCTYSPSGTFATVDLACAHTYVCECARVRVSVAGCARAVRVRACVCVRVCAVGQVHCAFVVVVAVVVDVVAVMVVMVVRGNPADRHMPVVQAW